MRHANLLRALLPLSARPSLSFQKILIYIKYMENMVDIVFLKQNAFILPPPMKAHELLSSPETWCQESPAEDPKFCGHNVLVVDDDNGVCRVIQRMLSDGSFKV
jgi:hypothetical protein